MSIDIEIVSEAAPHLLIIRPTQSKDKVMSHKMSGRPWESVRVDIFTINNKQYLCIVNYHSKFPVMNVEDFSTDNLIKMCKIIFWENRLFSKIV